MQTLSREGQVWLSKYFEDLKAYSFSGQSGSLENAAKSLEFFSQRCPEQGPFVQRLSLQAAMIGRYRNVPDIIQRLTRNGLAAYVTQNAASQVESIARNQILLTLSVEAHLEAEERSKGVMQLKKLKDFIASNRNVSVISKWAEANQLYIAAKLDEEILERQKAYASYKHALALLEPILANEAMLAAYKKQWVDLCYGDEMKESTGPHDDVYAVPDLEIKKTFTHCHLGVVRCQVFLLDKETPIQNALAAKEAIERFGLPPGSDPFSVIPLLAALPPESGKEHNQWIVSKGFLSLLEIPGLQSLLDNPVTKHVGEQMQKNLKAKLDAARIDWEAACKIGLAEALEREGDYKEASHVAFQGFELCRETDSLARIVASGYLARLLFDYQNPQYQGYLDYFSKAVTLGVVQNPVYWTNSFYRSLLGKPLMVVLEKAIEEYAKSQDREQSAKTSIWLNATRTEDLPHFLVFLKSEFGMPNLGDNVNKGLDTVHDYLGRISQALPNGALVMILQAVRKGTGMLLLSKKFAHPVWIIAEDQYQEAQAGLNASVGDVLTELQVTPEVNNEGLAKAGRGVFDALPAPVREAITNHETLLLVPDFSIESDVTPFELMQDGNVFLGESKITARFISLAHLARALDSTFPLHRRPRAIVTPVADATLVKADYLQAASAECQAVRDLLSREEFEVPETNSEFLTAKYFTDRFSFADILHIAAHGESLQGDEWLLLPNDEKFVVDDLYAKEQRSMPFVYLNTCHLGQTRYLGSGISRGFAFNFMELGAPALIANTIETLDDQTARLAVGFHRRALSMPVGEALRETRKDLLKKNISPVIWGSALLFGNPFHRLTKAKKTEKKVVDVSCDLLDAYFGEQKEKLKAVWKKAVNTLKAVRYHPKLEAAFLLVDGVDLLNQFDRNKTSSNFNQLIRLADALHHLPAQGYTRYAEFTWEYKKGDHKLAYSLVIELLPYLEALSLHAASWQQMLSHAKATKKRLELAFENRSPSMIGSGEAVTDQTMNAFLDVLYAGQESSKELYGEVEIREEKVVNDLLWNAVVLGHPNKFEDMMETTRFARQLAGKLSHKNALPVEYGEDAIALLAGMLRYLWSTQNVAYLDPSMATGQTGTLSALVNDIKEKWSSVKNSSLWHLMQEFLASVDRALKYLHSLKWEEIYKHMDTSFSALAKEGDEILQKIQEQDRGKLALCSGYLSGCIIQKNVYSPLDGSVPESFKERMDKLYDRLSSNQESDFYTYLWKGFESVRNKELTDIEKWTLEDFV